MKVYDKVYIGGEWVAPDGTGTIDVVSAHTEQVIGSVPDASPADMDRAVAAARQAFDDGPWPTMTPADRAEGIKRLSGALQARAQDLADTISAENGSPEVLVADGAGVLGHHGARRLRQLRGQLRLGGPPARRARLAGPGPAGAGRRRGGRPALERPALHRRAEARPGHGRRAARSS